MGFIGMQGIVKILLYGGKNMNHILDRSRGSNVKKFEASFLALIMVLTTMSTMMVIFATPVKADSPTLWTTDEYGNPKSDFVPGDVVYIHGSGFNPGSEVAITVTRPDGWVDTAPDGRFPPMLPVVESDGTFVYTYDLDGIEGIYTIDANDGTNYAQVTFTDWITSLTVLYPDGGETISGTINVQFYVTRTAGGGEGGANTVYVYYSKNSGSNWNLISSVNIPYGGTGTYNVLWDTTQDVNGINYRIGIAATYYGFLYIYDISNNDFTVDNYVVPQNVPPVAEAGGPYSGYAGVPIVLDGSGSYDIDGTIVLYEWDFDGDGYYDWNSPSTGITTTTYGAGTYTAKLRVTDDDGATGEDTASVDIILDNAAPVQTIQLGTPKDEDVYNAGPPMGWLDRASGITPIWINSTDAGVGSNFIEYYLFKRQVFNDPNSYEFVLYGKVYDDQPGDIDLVNPGRISVVLYVDESCYHQIDAYCEDKLGYGSWSSLDFLVDADGPTVQKEIGVPKCGSHVTTSTKIWLNATDPIVGSEYCSCQCVKEIHWIITVNGDPYYYYALGDKADFTFNEECTHTLEFWAVDCLGNEGPHTIQTHYVDNTPPTTTKQYGTPKYQTSETYITSGTPIYLNATDGGLCPVGHYTIYYRVWYNGVWTTWMHGAPNSNVVLTMNDLGAPWNGDCKHFIEYYAVDCLGNTETPIHNQTFYVDNTGPIVNKDIGQPKRDFNGKNFITKATEIWLNATDQAGNCACGVKEVHYIITYPNMTTKEFIVPGDKAQFTFAENCTHGLEFWAVDYLGNQGDHTTQTHYVDTETPTSVSEYIPPAYVKLEGDEYTNYITNRTVKRITAMDRGCNVGGVGVQRIEWKVFNATENGGLGSVIASGMVYDNSIYSYDNGRVIVTGDNDPREGFVSIDITIKEDCIHYIWHQAFDYFGNFETIKKQRVKVDSKPPIVTKEIGEPRYPGPVEGSYYVTRATPIWINATDDDTSWPCNVSSVHMRVGIWYNGLWNYTWYNVTSGSINVSFTFDSAGVGNDCVHYVTFWAEDDLGNSILEDNETFYVDNTPPVVTKQVGEPKYSVGLPAGDYYVTSLTPIWINVTDAGVPPCIVGSVHLYYRIWYQGQWTYYNANSLSGTLSELIYLADGECVHYLEYYAIDDLGNYVYGDNETFYVDNTPPIVQKQVGDCKVPTGCYDYYVNSDTPIWLNVTNPGVGPCIVPDWTLYYNIQYNGVWHNYTSNNMNVVFHFGQFPWNGECVHELVVWVEDALHNKYSITTELFYVDDTAPTAQKQIGSPKYKGSLPGDDYYVTSSTPIWINVTNGGTDPCIVPGWTLHYSIKYNDIWHDYTSRSNVCFHFGQFVDWSDECVHELVFWVEDDVCNVGPMHAEKFYVDDTPPISTKEIGQPKYPGYMPFIDDWYVTKDTPIWINVTDSGVSPCIVGSVHLYYRIWYRDQWTYFEKSALSGTLSELIHFNDGECVHILEYYVEDNLGNRWPRFGWHTEVFYVDNTPPVVTKEVGEPKYTENLPAGVDYYVTKDTPIWIRAEDSGTWPCIVGSVHLRIGVKYNDGEWQYWWRNVSSGSIHEMFTFDQLGVGDDCIHYVSYWAEDDLGNCIAEDVETFYVDNTPPQSQKSFIGPTYNHVGEPENYWLRDHDTWVILDSTDLGTSPCIVGVKYLHVELWMASDGYNIDTLVWTKDVFDQGTYDSNNAVGEIQYKFQIEQDCLHEIRWYGVDKLGNIEIDQGTSPQQVVIFHDDFENDLSQWVSHRVTRKSDIYSIDGYYAELDSIDDINYAWMFTTISTIDHNNVVLSYDARTRDTGSGDTLWVGWRIGTSGPWNWVNALRHNDWRHYSHTLIGAENQPVVQILFLLNFDHDYGLVDNVMVTTGTTKMHLQQHRVDSTPPEIVKIVSEPSLGPFEDPETGNDIWWVTDQTEIDLSQTHDAEEPCAVGLKEIKYRMWYLGHWTEWMIYTEKIHFEEHCTHYLEVWAIDYLGNNVTDNETFIVHAEIAEHPTLVSPEYGALLDDSTPMLVWNPVPGKDYYRVEWSTDIDFGTFSYSNVTGTEYTLPVLPDGKYYWRVAIIYTGGAIGQWSDVWTFTIDTTAPVIESVDCSDADRVVVAGDEVIITVTEANDETGLIGTVVIDGVQRGLIDNHDGTYSYAWCIPESQTPDDYTVTAALTDILGHSDTDNSLVITVIATSGPVSSILDVTPDPAENQITLIAEVTSDEALIAAAEYKIGLAGTPVSIPATSLGDGSYGDSTYESITHVIDISGLADGDYVLFLRAQDENSNWGAWDEEEFTVDKAAPTITVDTITSPVSDILHIMTSGVSDDVVDVVFEYSNGGTTWYTIGTDDIGPTFTIDWDTTSVPDGHNYYVKATATDDVGKISSDTEGPFEIDNGIMGTPTLVKPVDASYLKYIPVLVWNPVEDATDYYVELADNVDFSSPLLSQPVAGTTYDTISLGLVDNVVYYWHVAARDSDGDCGQWSDTWWFKIDTTAPDEFTIDDYGWVSGTITYTVTDLDATDIAIVVFEIQPTSGGDRTVFAVDFESPYNGLLDTTEYGDGDYTVYVTAYDYAGNSRSAYDAISIDNAPPTVDITSPLPGEEVQGIVEITYTTGDGSGSGVDTEYISIDGGDWIEITTPGSYMWNTTLVNDGEHIITVKAVDMLGNTGTDWIMVTVDNTPECIAFISPIAGQWYTEDVIAEVTAPDDTLKVVFTACNMAPYTDDDGSDGWTALIPLGTGDGPCVISATAYDELEQIICTREITVYRDNTPPSATQLDINDPDQDGFDTDGDISVTWFSADDEGIGVLYYEGEASMDPDFITGVINTGYITELFASFNDVPMDGTWYARVRAIDGLWNVGDWSNVESIIVDRVAPELTIENPSPGEQLDGVVSIEYSATDVNGISGYEVFIDGESVYTGDSPYVWDTTEYSDGAHLIKVKATDNPGHITEEEILVYVDNTPGSVSVIYPHDGQEFYGPDPDYFVTVTVTAPDNTDYIVFTGEFGEYTDYDPEWEYDWLIGGYGAGEHTITATAYDEMGEVIDSDSVTIVIYIDMTPPPKVPMLMHVDDGLGEYIYDADGTITMIWSAVYDDQSGVDYYELEISDGYEYIILVVEAEGVEEFVTYTVSDLPDDEYYLWVRAVDHAGNQGDWSDMDTVIVDKVAPELTISHPVPDEKLMGAVLIEYSANDIHTPITYEVFIDGGYVYSGVSPYVWDTTAYNDGTHTIKVTATDAAGNIAEDEVTVQVDNTPGSVSIIYPHDGQSFPEGEEMVIVTVTAPDNTDYIVFSGEFGEYTDYDPEWEYEWMIEEYEVGEHSITATAYDENEQEIGSDTITIEIIPVSHYRPIFIEIISPEDDQVLNSRDDKYAHVIIDARYWDDPYYLDVDELTVTLKLDEPYGAPDLYYEVIYDEENHVFRADVDIYKYSTGSSLDLEAKAEDIYNNRAYDDLSFTVDTTVEYDRWMKKGWNGPINIAVLGCDDSVVSVFASIFDDTYSVFELGTWKNYKFHPPGQGGNLQHIDPSEWYWVYMDNAARFYIDANGPIVDIEYPEDESYANLFEDIHGTAYDVETSVTEVVISIRDTYDGKYWNGGSWQSASVNLLCTGTETWYYADTGYIDWTGRRGHIIEITATATDMAGCQGFDMVSFIFDDIPPISYIDEIPPAVNYAPDIAGYATDNLALDYIEVQLTDGTNYWMGSGWTTTETWFIFDLEGTMDDWDIIDPTIDDYTNGQSYTITAKATDLAGNHELTAIEIFIYDSPGVDGKPYVEITYPEDMETYICEEPTHITGTCSDDESWVTSVQIKIRDHTAEPDLWWDGDSWELTPTYLECVLDTDEWYYTTGIIWQDGHDYSVYATCYDAAGNQAEEDDVFFSYICEELHEISGEIYYNGEQSGDIAVVLFDEFPDEGVDPIDGYWIPSPEIYPVPYSFTVPDGTYYTGAFMDVNDNDVYDEGEPLGFAVNKLPGSADQIVVSGGDVTGQDITLYEILDFGDAPDPTYPTLLANNGARHIIGGPFMGGMGGSSVDAETDGQPDGNALGDDNNGVPDDEDSLVGYYMCPGEYGYINIDMTSSPVNGVLNAWVDFNQDGDWDDPYEHILTDHPLTAGTINYELPFSVPNEAMMGLTFIRLRCDSTGGLQPFGLALDGEVEDYQVYIGGY